MKKLLATIFAAGLIAGSLGSVAHAGIICDLQKKLGVENVKECEDYPQ